MSSPHLAGFVVLDRYARLTTLTGLAAFFVFLPLALALPFLPPLHSTVVDQPA